MNDKLELQREILRLVELGDEEGLEELAVREGIARDLWRAWVAAMKQVDEITNTGPSYDFAGSAPDGDATPTQSGASGEGNDPASGAEDKGTQA